MIEDEKYWTIEYYERDIRRNSITSIYGNPLQAQGNNLYPQEERRQRINDWKFSEGDHVNLDAKTHKPWTTCVCGIGIVIGLVDVVLLYNYLSR